jgi:hypothetical protein
MIKRFLFLLIQCMLFSLFSEFLAPRHCITCQVIYRIFSIKHGNWMKTVVSKDILELNENIFVEVVKTQLVNSLAAVLVSLTSPIK